VTAFANCAGTSELKDQVYDDELLLVLHSQSQWDQTEE